MHRVAVVVRQELSHLIGDPPDNGLELGSIGPRRQMSLHIRELNAGTSSACSVSDSFETLRPVRQAVALSAGFLGSFTRPW